MEYNNTLKVSDSEKPIDLYSFVYSQFQTKKASHQQENRNCNELTVKEAAELLFADLTKGTSQDSEDITWKMFLFFYLQDIEHTLKKSFIKIYFIFVHNF